MNGRKRWEIERDGIYMSTIEKWTAVDQYMSDVLIPKDSTLERVLQANAAANLPAHDVSPTQGKFLQLLVQIQGARNILEIGTLGGYSTIWIARGLPSGATSCYIGSKMKNMQKLHVAILNVLI